MWNDRSFPDLMFGEIDNWTVHKRPRGNRLDQDRGVNKGFVFKRHHGSPDGLENLRAGFDEFMVHQLAFLFQSLKFALDRRQLMLHFVQKGFHPMAMRGGRFRHWRNRRPQIIRPSFLDEVRHATSLLGSRWFEKQPIHKKNHKHCNRCGNATEQHQLCLALTRSQLRHHQSNHRLHNCPRYTNNVRKTSRQTVHPNKQ